MSYDGDDFIITTHPCNAYIFFSCIFGSFYKLCKKVISKRKHRHDYPWRTSSILREIKHNSIYLDMLPKVPWKFRVKVCVRELLAIAWTLSLAARKGVLLKIHFLKHGSVRALCGKLSTSCAGFSLNNLVFDFLRKYFVGTSVSNDFNDFWLKNVSYTRTP